MFVRNHAGELWACDFLTQYTATFTVAYVFVVMEIASRRVAHFNVTTAPTLAWVKQQLREATPWGATPRFLVHDNDGIYGQYRPPLRVERDGRTRRYRCHLDRWLHEVMGIQGIPIPYGAPNASPHVERFVRTLREEALDTHDAPAQRLDAAANRTPVPSSHEPSSRSSRHGSPA